MIADVPASVLAAIAPSPTTAAPSATVPNRRASPPGVTITALDQLSERRVLRYTDKIGYGLTDGRKCAAYRLACFYQHDVGLADDLAFHCLASWNALNSPPLADDVLRDIHVNASKYARGAA